ncbi:unnamed protein product, partial [Rotaria sordida]
GLDLNEVAYDDEPSKIYLGLRSIICLLLGRLVANHDFFGPGYPSQPRNVLVYISDNNDETWDYGLSWNYNGSDDGVILFHNSCATGPTPIVITNQVMYRGI